MMFWSVVMMYSSQKVTYIVVILHLAKRQLRFCKIKKSLFHFKFESGNEFESIYKSENMCMKDNHIYIASNDITH